MCPFCMTTAVIAASTTTGAGVLGFAAMKLRSLRRKRREQAAKSAPSKRNGQ